VVSHTPIECEKLLGVQKAGGWIDAVRTFVPEPTKPLHLVELSLARLDQIRQRPPARPHLDVGQARRTCIGHRGRQGIPER